MKWREALAQRAKADGVHLTEAAATVVVSALVEEILSRVEAGETVVIKGLGRFWAEEKKARFGRHPVTGERLPIPAVVALRFRAESTCAERMKRAKPAT